MEAFELVDLITVQQRVNEPYLEFFRSDSMSLGLFVMPAGAVYPQDPHTEDEVYYIVSGAGRLRVGDEERDLKPGTTVFVEAGAERAFTSTNENLILLVAFVPPRGSRATPG